MTPLRMSRDLLSGPIGVLYGDASTNERALHFRGAVALLSPMAIIAVSVSRPFVAYKLFLLVISSQHINTIIQLCPFEKDNYCTRKLVQ